MVTLKPKQMHVFKGETWILSAHILRCANNIQGTERRKTHFYRKRSPTNMINNIMKYKTVVLLLLLHLSSNLAQHGMEI